MIIRPLINFDVHKAIQIFNLPLSLYEIVFNKRILESDLPDYACTYNVKSYDLIAALHDDVSLGYTSLAITVIQAPIIVVGNSIVQTCSRYLSDSSVNPGVIAQRFKKITGLILFASVLPCAVFSYFSADIFALVFGDNWRRSGDFAGVLSLLLLFILVSRPAIPLITILKEEVFFLRFELISVSIKVLAILFVDKLYGSIVLDLLAFGVVSSIFYVYLISNVYRKLLADA